MAWESALAHSLVPCSEWTELKHLPANPNSAFHSISEISPPAERGMLMSGYQTMLQLSALAGFWGAFAANSIFSDTSNLQWQLPVAIQLIPGAFLLIGACFIPETPQFLASKGRWTAVAQSLAWLRQMSQDDDDLLDEINEIRVTAELYKAMQNRQQISFFKEAMKKPVRKRLGVGIGLMIAQNMVGLNALNYCKSCRSGL